MCRDDEYMYKLNYNIIVTPPSTPSLPCCTHTPLTSPFKKTPQTSSLTAVLWMTELYRWQELPQVSFLSQQKFCQDKRVVTKQSLSWQKCARCDKVMFVATNMCLLHNFVATKVLSWQVYFCHDKHMLVMTKHVKSLNFCHNKIMFVATKVLSWQNIFSCGKFCHNRHIFVTTKDVFCRTILLSQQKLYLYGSPRQWQNYTY